MRHLMPYILVLLGFASISTGQTEILARPRGAVSVAVLALPGSIGPVSSTRETRHLANTIATALRAAHFTVLVAGVTDGVPLEELSAKANMRLVDVALGVWDVAASTLCAAVLAPAPVSPPEPESFKFPMDEAKLARLLSEMAASSRSKASARLASALSSAGTWCDRAPTENETYLLEGTQMPTVIIAAANTNESTLANRIPALLKEWLAVERNSDRTTSP